MSTPVFQSTISPTSSEYLANHEAMSALVADLHAHLNSAASPGPDRHVATHLSRGQLLARDRVSLVLDDDSPMLELMPLAGLNQDDMTLGGSVIIALGLVEGTPCLVSAAVPTLAGGASNEVTVLKSLRAQEIARANRLPFVSLVQTAGANLTQQAKVFHRGGETFRNMARLSKMGVPSVAVVFGSSTAGGAYVPGMADYSVMVQRQAKVFLGGPPLVYAATGEVTDDETLGGADMHARVSGVADALAVDELAALRIAREFVRHWGYAQRAGEVVPRGLAGPDRPPLYPAEELLGVISPNPRIPFDAREVLARIVDASEWVDFKPLYGSNLITVFASIHGIPVGIIANNNCLFPAEANKATQFIRLCEMKGVPIVFLHNITGFMVGKSFEEQGIIKAGAQFINAVANAQVPLVSVLIGASYGAGNYAMAGRAYEPRFLFSYPNSKCSVMGADQLVNVMDIVARQSAERSKKPVNEDRLAAQKAMLHAMVEDESSCWFTTSRVLDDGVIDPRDTRDALGMVLHVVYPTVPAERQLVGVSRM
ncbi:Acetyl-coenzyme A carboxylase carboxyl transferase subunit beta 2 [Allomyces javanicus]|nr:Acetyl-coenzyme A carboxylase carboxyl transferase subunit beta 2 [Allomyces javanicus]